MRTDIKQIIKIANARNGKLRTVEKARNRLLDQLEDAVDDVNELISVNKKLAKITNIIESQEYPELCDRSKALYDRIKVMEVYKNIDLLTELLNNPDIELATLADELIDLVDENDEHLIGRINPLKGYGSNPIPL